jgi:large subunit ribosomal protein L18
MSTKPNTQRRDRRKHHIRKKIQGTAERPRLSVFRSASHIYVQAIDDLSGRTVAQASSLNDPTVKGLVEGEKGKVGLSVAVGKAIAQRLKEQNISAAVFDRNGYLYHGRVKAVADGAREGGLQV